MRTKAAQKWNWMELQADMDENTDGTEMLLRQIKPSQNVEGLKRVCPPPPKVCSKQR